MQIDSEQFMIKTLKENSLPQEFSDISLLLEDFVEKISAAIYFLFFTKHRQSNQTEGFTD